MTIDAERLLAWLAKRAAKAKSKIKLYRPTEEQHYDFGRLNAYEATIREVKGGQFDIKPEEQSK
jgi:hypothetical protein